MTSNTGKSAQSAGTATVVLPSVLVDFAGGRSHIPIHVDTALDPPRLSLGTLLDRLAAEAPALERRIRDERKQIRGHVNVFVDGVDIRELGGSGTEVVGGAKVQIIAAVSGG